MPIPPVSCTDTELLVRRPLEDLDADVANMIRWWLLEHLLDDTRLQLGKPILRNPEKRILTWTEHCPEAPWTHVEGPPAHMRAVKEWPAPFPEDLRALTQPDTCPRCGTRSEADLNQAELTAGPR